MTYLKEKEGVNPLEHLNDSLIEELREDRHTVKAKDQALYELRMTGTENLTSTEQRDVRLKTRRIKRSCKKRIKQYTRMVLKTICMMHNRKKTK